MDFCIHFSSAFVVQQSHIPGSARIGEYHVGAGEWRRRLPKSSCQRKEGLGSKVAQAGIVRGKEAALLPSCSKDANTPLDPARGPGARDRTQQSVTSAFCDCCPKNQRGSFCCSSALGWRALRGFLEGRQCLCALLPSPPHNGFLGFVI